MATFLQPNELLDSYRTAQEEARRYFERFDEYERLSANRVRTDLDPIYPKVTDGTMAAMMPENAMRRFQKLHTGHFTSIDRDEGWLLELLNILWSRVIIPGAKSDADFFTKFWNMYYRSQQHGVVTAFAFFTTRDGYSGADFTVDYVRDVVQEPGKLSFDSSNYIWRNSYHTKLDLQNIIEYAEKEQQRAKAEKRETFSTWDIESLKAFVNAGPQGKDQLDTPLTEQQKRLVATHYKLSTAYHKGYKAPFYTMIPNMEGRICRTRKNENPTGDTPIIAMYHVQDLISPYGVGVPERAGAQQNVLDYMTAADVLATQKGLRPPKKIKGAGDASTGLIMKTITDAPDAKWRVGNADVSVVDTGTSIYTQIAEHISRYKTNLLTQMGSFDTTAGTSAGNPQFSRTPAGVNSLDERTTVNDNFHSNNGATAFAQLARVMMNIHMANMQGTEVFTLLEDEVERLQNAGWDLQGNKKALLEYDNLRGKFDFVVDDPRQLDDPETEGLSNAITTISEHPDFVSDIDNDGKYHVDKGELLREYLSKLQLSNIDKIVVPVKTGDAANEGEIAPPTAGTPTDGTDATAQDTGNPGTVPAAPAIPAQGAPKPPSVSMSFKDVAAVAPGAAAVMLQQADLPGDELLIKAKAAAQVQSLAPPSPTPQPQPAQPEQPQDQQQTPAQMPETTASLQAELARTMKKYSVDQEAAAMIMAARRSGVSEQEIAAYFQGGK